MPGENNSHRQTRTTHLPPLTLPELLLAISLREGGRGRPGMTREGVVVVRLLLLVLFVFQVSNTSLSSAVRCVSVEGTLAHDTGVVPAM